MMEVQAVEHSRDVFSGELREDGRDSDCDLKTPWRVALDITS